MSGSWSCSLSRWSNLHSLVLSSACVVRDIVRDWHCSYITMLKQHARYMQLHVYGLSNGYIYGKFILIRFYTICCSTLIFVLNSHVTNINNWTKYNVNRISSISYFPISKLGRVMRYSINSKVETIHRKIHNY